MDECRDLAVQMILDLLAASNKGILIDIGGGAAMANYTHNDFYKAAGDPCLVYTEVPFLTALTNDNSYTGGLLNSRLSFGQSQAIYWSP